MENSPQVAESGWVLITREGLLKVDLLAGIRFTDQDRD
jgi:hypothetical protein